MARPLHVTFQALGLYLFSAMALIGGLFAYVAPLEGGVHRWVLSGAFYVAGLLGIRAGHRMMAQSATTSRAVVDFALVAALVPVAIYYTFPPEHRADVLFPALVGSLLFVAVGLVIARLAKRRLGGAA